MSNALWHHVVRTVEGNKVVLRKSGLGNVRVMSLLIPVELPKRRFEATLSAAAAISNKGYAGILLMGDAGFVGMTYQSKDYPDVEGTFVSVYDKEIVVHVRDKDYKMHRVSFNVRKAYDRLMKGKSYTPCFLEEKDC